MVQGEGAQGPVLIGDAAPMAQLHRDIAVAARSNPKVLIVGETGQEPAFARLPDIGLELVGQSLLDGRIVLSEYRPSGLPPYAS